MRKVKFVSPLVRLIPILVACTEELQTIKRKILENGLKGPEFKILKNKNKNVPRSTVPKNYVPMSKTDSILSRSNVTWTVPFVDT